jgi:hypothetical protein
MRRSWGRRCCSIIFNGRQSSILPGASWSLLRDLYFQGKIPRGKSFVGWSASGAEAVVSQAVMSRLKPRPTKQGLLQARAASQILHGWILRFTSCGLGAQRAAPLHELARA